MTFDHRGAGENLNGPISRNELIADLFALMDDLGMDRAVVAAESMGVGIVLAAALEKPERFRGLVLVDGAPAFPQERSGALAAGLRAQFVPTLESFVAKSVPEPAHDHVRRWGMHILTRSTPELAAELIECVWGLDLTERLAELEVPVLILHGEDDRIIPTSVAHLMAARLPQSRLVLLEGTGHVPTLTAPKRVADEMASFLDEVV